MASTAWVVIAIVLIIIGLIAIGVGAFVVKGTFKYVLIALGAILLIGGIIALIYGIRKKPKAKVVAVPLATVKQTTTTATTTVPAITAPVIPLPATITQIAPAPIINQCAMPVNVVPICVY
jgi:uncharacterized membrane protein HdeD (DUF308 family)